MNAGLWELQKIIAQLFKYGELDILLTSFLENGITDIVDVHDAWPHQVLEVLRHAKRNGYLPELIDAAAAERPRSDLPKLAQALHRDEDLRFDPQLRKELLTTLDEAEIRDELILGAYRMFAPTTWIYVIDEKGLKSVRRAVVANLIHILSTQQLIAVVLYLAHVTADTVAGTSLLAWIQTARNVLRVDFDKATQTVYDIIERYRKVRLHLVIVVRPEPEESLYAVTAWRQLVNLTGDVVDPMKRIEGPHSYSESALEGVVERFIGRVESERKTIASELQSKPTGPELERQFVVELILPLSLLARPADQWRVTLHPQPAFTLGIRHWLVVRSWERAYEAGPGYDIVRSEWAYYWNLRKKKGVALLCDEIHFETYSDHVSANDAWAVALRFVPDERHWRDVVMTGTPVALWMREDVHPAYEVFVNGILNHPVDWRKSVSSERGANEKPQVQQPAFLDDDAGEPLPPVGIKKAQMIPGTFEKPHAQRMTLLWDDADEKRLPPDEIRKVQMIPPTVRVGP